MFREILSIPGLWPPWLSTERETADNGMQTATLQWKIQKCKKKPTECTQYKHRSAVNM